MTTFFLFDAETIIAFAVFSIAQTTKTIERNNPKWPDKQLEKNGWKTKQQAGLVRESKIMPNK